MQSCPGHTLHLGGMQAVAGRCGRLRRRMRRHRWSHLRILIMYPLRLPVPQVCGAELRVGVRCLSLPSIWLPLVGDANIPEIPSTGGGLSPGESSGTSPLSDLLQPKPGEPEAPDQPATPESSENKASLVPPCIAPTCSLLTASARCSLSRYAEATSNPATHAWVEILPRNAPVHWGPNAIETGPFIVVRYVAMHELLRYFHKGIMYIW